MNREFVVEFVRLIPRPLKTKSGIHLVNIVERGIKINVDEMWPDESLSKLFQSNTHMLMVYAYVRDNQEIFLGK